ncbi:MAG TPA: DUF2865 domain-containing protein [Pseudolabrys sp.]|nr:DUF2865 domain-containing protein [Pseudolabrys sp.]
MKDFLVESACSAALAAALSLAACAGALAQAPNPACQQLEGQLTAIDRGNADPARAAELKRMEDAVNNQQFQVDRLVSQGRQMGCENSGLFSIFSNPPPQCGPLNRQIGQQRNTLERMQNQLEQMQGGTTQRAAQRQSLLIALANNNCGPQYRSAALAGQQGGFFDRLFGNSTNNGNIINNTPAGPMGGTYRTICVRTCDGYYFPISFATTPDRFRDDEQACQRMCPAAEVQLYTYHNPGEEVSQAVSLNGRLYTELPTAFQYRKALNPACSCRRPGESWADALKAGGVDMTVAPGDVIVNEQNAKRMSLPLRGADGKPIRYDPRVKTTPAAQQPATPAAQAPADTDPAKRQVRTVGPTFLPAR